MFNYTSYKIAPIMEKLVHFNYNICFLVQIRTQLACVNLENQNFTLFILQNLLKHK
jgi:hypothetical protein